jgi:hypothetical protein
MLDELIAGAAPLPPDEPRPAAGAAPGESIDEYAIVDAAGGVPAEGLLHDDLLATYLTAPDRLREALAGLGDEQLGAAAPDGGWSLKQYVVHLADTELHGLVRMRRVVAEPGTHLEPYAHDRWVRMLVGMTPVDAAVELFAALRRAGAAVFRAATPDQRARTCTHPEHGPISLDELLQAHTLHGEQHIAQIRAGREARGW